LSPSRNLRVCCLKKRGKLPKEEPKTERVTRISYTSAKKETGNRQKKGKRRKNRKARRSRSSLVKRGKNARNPISKKKKTSET